MEDKMQKKKKWSSNVSNIWKGDAWIANADVWYIDNR